MAASGQRSGFARASRATTAVTLSGLLLTACTGLGQLAPRPGGTAGPTGTATSSGTASPGGTESPNETASPSTDLTAGPSESSPTPGSTETPGATPSGVVPPSGSSTPSSSAAPVTCTEVTPVRIQKLTTEPRRTTEVVSVVSDGRNITSGTREQTDFADPGLEGPDGTVVEDEPTMNSIAALIAGSAKNVVLLERPEAPDTGADANNRPFNAPGTYVLFNASTPLVADVIVQCGGQEQRWVFTSESDPSTGQVNCAVEPPQANAIARLVYANNC